VFIYLDAVLIYPICSVLHPIWYLSRSKRSNSMQYCKQGLHLLLSNCNNILCFLENFGVLVCKEYYTAVVNLNTHLLQHHNVPAATQKQIIKHFSSFATVNLAKVALPNKPAQPIDKLGEPLDRLQCKTYSFITVNKDTMRMHYKKKTLASVGRREKLAL
jgi:hypothetical protein